MTKQLPDVELPRPAPVADAGPLDDALYDLVETRVRRLLVDNPIVATYLGIHTEDHRLGDPSRDAVLAEIAADRSHLAAIEALDPAGLSPSARFERDLELHNLRLGLFDSDEIRRWERRSTAAGELGDAVFLLFARGAAPLGERIERIADRLEAAPAFLERSKTRAAGPQVAALAADRGALRRGPAGPVRRGPRGGGRRPRRRGARPPRPVDRRAPTRPSRRTAAGSTGTLADATDDWPLGARALRRAGPAPGVRRPGRRRDPGDRLGAAAARTSRRGGRRRARSTPTPTCRASSTASSPTTRRRSTRRSRATATSCAAPAPTSIEHDLVDDPRRRDDRGPRRRPSTCARVMPFAAYFSPAAVRRRQARPVHRDAGRRRRPQRDARALLGVDLEHEHPRGLPGPPPPARGRLPPPVASPGCSPTRPSSSRAGACTPSS